MSEKPYNPELFEHTVAGDPMQSQYGTDVTLRDLFAAAALLVSGSRGLGPVILAQDAYGLADAMLAEREKTES